MVKYNYDRQAVPAGEKIRLEIQFKDSAGNPKDASSFPSVSITDGASVVAYGPTTSGVVRSSVGLYRIDYIVPDGYTEGVWNDTWSGTLDGYGASATFDFRVSSVGSIEAAGAGVPEPEMRIGDAAHINYSQDEIYGINILMKTLRTRLRNNQTLPTGLQCDIFESNDLADFLNAALSDFNSTPTITTYLFSSPMIYNLFSDVIVEGAYIKALAALAPIQAGSELTITDNGTSLTPPQISSMIMNVATTMLSDYRARLKEIKRNHRPSAIGMGAGTIANQSPAYLKLRHRRANRLV